MTRHLSAESLSALLDHEASAAEARSASSHLATCVACRGHLEALRRTIYGAATLTPVAPPQDLAARVSQRIAAGNPAASAAATAATGAAVTRAAATIGFSATAAGATGAREMPRRPGASGPQPAGARNLSLLVAGQRPAAPVAAAGAWGAWLPGVARRVRVALGGALRAAGIDAHAWRTGTLSGAGAPFGFALALCLVVLLVRDGSLPARRAADLLQGTAPAGAAPPPEFLVSESFGDVPALPPQTTSEVAGRVFVLSDDVWVERGVDAASAQPRARVDARSPQGRQLLERYSGLGVLLADGSRVVLLDHRQTLELSNNS